MHNGRVDLPIKVTTHGPNEVDNALYLVTSTESLVDAFTAQAEVKGCSEKLSRNNLQIRGHNLLLLTEHLAILPLEFE